jgi:hypothetical protein
MRHQKEVNYSLQLLIQLQKLSSRDRQSGYALLMASVMSILIFSMLTIYLFSSRVSKSTTNALLDSGSTFYAAEYALNKRVNSIRSRIGNFGVPTGTSPTGTTVSDMMASCLGTTASAKGTNDFACNEESTNYGEATVLGGITNYGGVNTSSGFQRRSDVKYKSFSFVRNLSPAVPVLEIIPASQSYAGLRATDYKFRVYSTALKKADVSADVSAQSMLQMEFVDRFIPVFQFAAFYERDMEITSSPNMTIDGPIHSNANIHLAPGGTLTLNGKVSYVNSIYSSLLYQATHANTDKKIVFAGGGTNVNVTSDAWGAGPFPINILATDITASNNSITRTARLQLPPAGFLSRSGIYRNKADLRVDFDPLNASPTFNITRMNQSTATPTTVKDFSTVTGLIDSLQKPVMLRVTSDATRKTSEIVRLCPRLNGTNGDSDPNNTDTTKRAIPSLQTGSGKLGSPSDLPELNNTASAATSLTNRQKVVDALRKAIIMTSVSNVPYSATRAPATGVLLNNFRNALTNAGFTTGTIDKIVAEDLNEVAALNTDSLTVDGGGNGGCFLPAPMQMLLTGQFDKREGRNMYILQSNIKSLTAWNRDGVYGDGTVTGTLNSTADMLFTRKAATALVTVDNSSNISGANCDFDCLGLGALDSVRIGDTTTTTQGGLVWHYSLINRTDPGYTYLSNPSNPSATPPVYAVRDVNKGVSSYGFAFSGGARLPGALTVASDQAMYIQGDYNHPTSYPGIAPPTPDPLDDSALTATRTTTANPAAVEKKPAAVLGDSAIVLSNQCADGNFQLNCLRTFTATRIGDTTAGATNMIIANNTVVRAAILAGTEATVSATESSGGLNNHLSFRENWLGQTMKYRGSLVSQGIPSEFNGKFIPGCVDDCTSIKHIDTYYYPPTRDYGFDIDFNSVNGLPPLTPNANLVIQKVYKRDYDSQNRN